MRECLNCSFPAPDGARHCPKCDAELGRQSDGSTATVDIGHHRETVEQALAKLRAAVAHHAHRPTRCLRVIVGGGKIGDAVRAALTGLQAQRVIRRFDFEGHNRGAFLVQLKR
jgi:hypothetical protein